MQWVVPGNLKNYDVFSEIKKYGVIEWRQGKYNIRENDVVYIYLSKPEGYVAFKCIVEAVNIRRSGLKIDDGEYFLNDTLKPANRYMRLRPIKQYPSEYITFEKMKDAGMPTIQSARIATPGFLKLVNSVENK